MEMYGKIRCVTYSELVGSGILSKPSYDKKVREGVLQIVQRGGNGRVALIGYDSRRRKGDERKNDEQYDTIRQ